MQSIDAVKAPNFGEFQGEQDLGPLAWVLDELRKSMDGAVKALRRFVYEADMGRGSDLAALDVAPLRLARQQLHQVGGALEMVGMAAPAMVLRTMESAVQKFVQRPEMCTDEAAGMLERASFALGEYLDNVLAGKTVSAVALFPQYRDVQSINGVTSVHPADLWPVERRFREPEFKLTHPALPYGKAARARLDKAVLKIVKNADTDAARDLRDVCLGLAASQGAPRLRAFWKIGAGFFEAFSLGLFKPDVYAKRVTSRILMQYATLARGEPALTERLIQDLLFFCAQADVSAPGEAPVLEAVRKAFALERFPSVDYEARRFGRFDPAVLAQARKRIAAAAETWSALAGGDRNKFKQTSDQFSLVCDSLRKLQRSSEGLAQALTRAVDLTVRADEPPSAGLAMEVATSVLYLQAALEEMDTPPEQLAQRAQRLAERLDRVCAGAEPEPLESWMEELYRHFSDRQTMGSVVGELRATLGEAERAMDQFFRDPQNTVSLATVPTFLGQMRGVLSVLGLDQASLAVTRMCETVERLLSGQISDASERQQTFEKLGNSLGTLGFLVDMLSYQRTLARKLFVYDEALGELRSLMGRDRVREGDALQEETLLREQRSSEVLPAVQAQEPELLADLLFPVDEPFKAPAALHARTVPEPSALPQLPVAVQALQPLAEPLPYVPELAIEPGLLLSPEHAAEEPLSVPLHIPEMLAELQKDTVPLDVQVETGAFGTAAPALPSALPAVVSHPAIDDELLEIFLEEVCEVEANGRAALEALDAEPGNLSEQTTLRRAFHTLKGSSRMVGLNEFGEAAWSIEQLLNAWLAEQKPMNAPLLQLAGQALQGFVRWADAIATGDASAWQASVFIHAAEALQEGAELPLLLPSLPAVASAAEASLQSQDAVPAQDSVLATEKQADPFLGAPLDGASLAHSFDETDAEEQQQEEEEKAFLLESLDFADTQTLQTSETDDSQWSFQDALSTQQSATSATDWTEPVPEASTPASLADAEEIDFSEFSAALADADADVVTSADAVDAEKHSMDAAQESVQEDNTAEQLQTASLMDSAEPAEAAEAAEFSAFFELADEAPLATSVQLEDSVSLEESAEENAGDAPLEMPAAKTFEATAVFTAVAGQEAVQDDVFIEVENEAAQEPQLLDENAESTEAYSEPVGETSQKDLMPLHSVEQQEPAFDALDLFEVKSVEPEGEGVDAIAVPVHSEPETVPSDVCEPDFALEATEVEIPAEVETAEAEAVDLVAQAELPPETGAPAVHELQVQDPADAFSPTLQSRADESTKVIGSLRIGAALYNVYLNEADEWSRNLDTVLQEWSLRPDRPVPDAAIALAHSMAGSSATVGFMDLSNTARLLENALAHVQLQPQKPHTQIPVFVAASEDIRRLLHQFAAGFLKEASPLVQQELRLILATDVGSAQPHVGMEDLMEQAVAISEENEESASAAFVDGAALAEVQELDEEPVMASASAPESGLETEAEPAAMPALEAVAEEENQAAQTSDHGFENSIALSMASVMDLDDDIDVLDVIDPDLFQFFEDEALELLPNLGGSLRQWMAEPTHLGARSEVLRALHTLKGSSRLAGAMRLGEMAHRMESAIEQLDPETVRSQDIEPLLASFDGLQANFEVLRAIAAQPQTPAQEAAVAPVPSPVRVAGVEDAALRTTTAAVAPLAAPSALPKLAARPALLRVSAGQSVRVRAQLLDRLVNQAGEVMITRSRLEARLGQLKGSMTDLSGNLERLRQQLRDIEVQSESQMQSRLALSRDSGAGFDPLEFDRFTRVQELTRMMAESVNDVATVQRNLQRAIDGTEDELVAQGRQARELQRDLLRTRMVEFEGISERLYAVVRQSSKETGKQIRLEITGGAIEMDRGVLDRMTPAFEHLLRNCVAHGIEAPEVRQAADKPAAGTITVALKQEGNDVSVEFRDDGAGLDVARIRAKALALGLIGPDDEVGETEAAQLIFAPGFTTASVVTEISGRGIGMDVVRSEVNALGGRIETTTRSGQGSSFRMVLPLTTAVTQVVMLRMGKLSMGVPASLIDIVRRVPEAEVQAAYQSGSFAVGDTTVPFYWAGQLLQASQRSNETVAGKTLPVVVLRSASQRIAMHVDEVLGNQEVVVKNLGPQLARLPGLAGMSVLASGAVVLIYNPVALSTVYGEQLRASQADAAGAALTEDGVPGALLPLPVQNPVPLVLVVDDSITVRRVTQRLLQREGYRVALAADGLQALERLQDERPAVVLSDIEMPRMDGFDLARNIRADAVMGDLPIIMITSRIAQKHREHAMQLGVNHYLGKPYSDEELLGLVQQYSRLAMDVAL